jgi:hypothetical protein
MKRIIYRSLIFIFFLISIFVIYLSTIGIETNRFNNQIENIIKDYDEDLNIELKKIKIVLDPLNLEINVKTIGPKLQSKKKAIEIERVQTQIAINSLINNNFSLKNLEISTKSLEIKNLISFVRSFKNTPELYLLEKIFKRGHLVSDINIEFDKEGKITENYKVKGFIKNAKISLLKKYNLDRINLIFDFKKNEYKFTEVDLLLNNLSLFSKEIYVKSLQKNFLVNGSIENKNTSFDDEIFQRLINSYFKNLEFKKIDLNFKNKFSFKIDKNYKFSDLEISSETFLKNVKFTNHLKFNKFLPNLKEDIELNNHKLNINFKKNSLSLKGKGVILLQEKGDIIDYHFVNNNKKFLFNCNLTIEKNPLKIEFLGYKKKPNKKATISLKGSHVFGNKTLIEKLSLTEKKNKFNIYQLVLDINQNIDHFKKINLHYFDKDMRENKLDLIKNNKRYDLKGPKFNANFVIENFINDDSESLKIKFNKDLNLNIKIDQVYLDGDFKMSNLEGTLALNKNEIDNANLNASFSEDKNFKFTIKSNNQEKVTTLFLDQPEPILKRYKFIKGFKNGSLDFYSSKKENMSVSNLKIYDFRLKELPILTKLLTLASLQGIADILSGEGITFDEFEMNFKNNGNLMVIDELYAIGPAISILMEGYLEKNKLISLRGSLVPATTINKAIGNIPVLGKILVGSKTGEGVFGVSFKIKGPPKNPETTVNPIKTLTPRFITRTLEKIKKN